MNNLKEINQDAVWKYTNEWETIRLEGCFNYKDNQVICWKYNKENLGFTINCLFDSNDISAKKLKELENFVKKTF